MATLIDYKNKKLLNQEEKSTQDVQFMVSQTELNMQQDALVTKQELYAKEKDLENLKLRYPFDMAKYIKLRGEINSLKEGLKAIAEVQQEFGFSVTANIK